MSSAKHFDRGHEQMPPANDAPHGERVEASCRLSASASWPFRAAFDRLLGTVNASTGETNNRLIDLFLHSISMAWTPGQDAEQLSGEAQRVAPHIHLAHHALRGPSGNARTLTSPRTAESGKDLGI